MAKNNSNSSSDTTKSDVSTDTFQATSATTCESSAPALPAAPASGKKRELPTRAIYMGPTFLENGIVFKNGDIFNNGVPDKWKAKAKADPNFRRLVVAVDKTNDALRFLADKNSVLSECYRQVAAAYIASKSKEAK